MQGTPLELVPCLLLSLKILYKLGYMENANLRLQATPLENPGPVQGATPPSGDMEVPNVPKLARNFTINITASFITIGGFLQRLFVPFI